MTRSESTGSTGRDGGGNHQGRDGTSRKIEPEQPFESHLVLVPLSFSFSPSAGRGADATSLQIDFRLISRVAACGQFYSGTRVPSAPLQTGRVSHFP